MLSYKSEMEFEAKKDFNETRSNFVNVLGKKWPMFIHMSYLILYTFAARDYTWQICHQINILVRLVFIIYQNDSIQLQT